MKNKSFYFIWAGQSIANLGDSFYVLVLTLWTYQLTDSAFAASLVAMMQFVGQSVSAVFIPVFTSKYSLKKILIFLQLSQTILLAGLIALFSINLEIVMIAFFFLIVLMMSLLDGGTIPVRNSMIPRFVSKNVLLKANSLVLTSDQIVRLLGWLLGGMLAQWLGAQWLLTVTLILYGTSTLSLFFIIDTGKEDPEPKEKYSFMDKLLSGWKAIYQMPDIRMLTILEMLSMCGRSIWTGAIILVYVNEVLHKSETWWGFINASYFAGTITGGVLVWKFSNKIRKSLFAMILWTSLAIGAATLALALNRYALASLCVVFILGPAFQLRGIAIRTYVQERIQDNMLPKVLSAQHTLSTFVYGLSILIMSSITDIYGVQYVFFTNFFIFLISAILSLKLKNEQL
ncbi:MFS transporter [Bacillus swezeyi]|uniref:MFS transporter n=1 Tax=Bacillus swezeyi TaxID=1925020 RepID=A0A5M8RHH9_9BACI|nr:MFS transporter [Bacillus swezeyi]KAA6447669.1 MFS transporter [Bacillus swezeyi]KAA6473955.1 MFS transporter [Bacillus swezeyi]TYS34252.1 MFS transporter [Bacillus swezeyi]